MKKEPIVEDVDSPSVSIADNFTRSPIVEVYAVSGRSIFATYDLQIF